MKAINVSRVSTEEGREANNSLPAQFERIEAYCRKRAFEMIKLFSFQGSVHEGQMKGFDKLLELCVGSFKQGKSSYFLIQDK